MPNKKISELPVAGALTGAELIEVVQGGLNSQTTTQDIADLAGGGLVTSVNGQTGAVVLDTSDVDPTTDRNYVTDAQQTVISNTSGTNSGNETTSTLGATINGVSAATPNDTDLVTTVDTSVVKKITWTNVKTFLKTYFDTLYESVNNTVIGVQDLYIPATAMWPKTTGGCADLAKSEIATSLLNIQTLDFDQSTEEYAQFTIVLPRKYNNGTITAVFYWTASTGSGDVIWGLQGVANSNDDPLTTAFGTAQEVTDTLTATNDVCVTSATSAITIAGSPADADFIGFQIYRKAANGSDTLSADAKLLGVSLRITVDAGKDA